MAMFAGTLGAIGGGFAGTVCAALTALLDRWTGGPPAAGYAAVAAVAALAGAYLWRRSTQVSPTGFWRVRPTVTVGHALQKVKPHRSKVTIRG